MSRTRPDIALIETVRIRGGVAPLWGLHIRRLSQSCRALGIPFPQNLLAPSGGPDRVYRLEVSERGCEVTERAVGLADPVRLVTTSVVHHPYPHKTTERARFERAAAEARSRGADDGLLLTADGYVAETSIWGVFWWEGSQLCTPPLELGILPGVARAHIGELGSIAEQRMLRNGLDGRSVVLANAARGIVEVATLDGLPAPRSAHTATLRRAFWP